MAPAGREALLWRLADLIDKNAEELAELESLDNGKTKFMASVVDVPGARNYFRYMAGWATKIEGSTIDVSIGAPAGGRVNAYTRREPVGVVAQIIPWNFPLVMAAWKLGPALAGGCTCILKPAEQTPLTALRLGELIIEAGFPAGRREHTHGLRRDDGRGARDASRRRQDRVHGLDRGRQAHQQVGDRHAEARVARARRQVAGDRAAGRGPERRRSAARRGAIFFNAGQVCAAGSRLTCTARSSTRSSRASAARADDDPARPRPRPEHADGTAGVARAARARDGLHRVRPLRGRVDRRGRRGAVAPGYYVQPTVIADVKRSMRVVHEEIFGPVLVAQRFDDIDEVAALANDTQYGLSASVWSNDLTAVHRLVPKIRAGTVWVNGHSPVDANMPFGGFKQSGLGREHGRVGIEMYTELKSVCMFV